MRRMTEDPVAAGIDAFATVAGTVDTLRNSRQLREMRTQEMNDKKLMRERQAKLWSEEDEKKYGQKHLNNLASVYEAENTALSQGKEFKISDMSDDQIASVIYMGDHKNWFDKDGRIKSEKMLAIKSLGTFTQNPELAKAAQERGRIAVDLNKNKELGDAIEALFGDEINQGEDAAGNKATKRASKAYLDFSGNMPTVTFGLSVTPPKEGTANLIPLQGFEKDIYSIPEDPKPAGQIERGNIDLSKRKVALNKDGSISTVLSMSAEFDGKEVLIPRVNDTGKVMTPEEAIAEYKKTGKHLGVFEDRNSADRYAEKLHSTKLWQPSIDYYTKGSYEAPMTWGRNGSPNAPVKQIPLPLLGMQVESMERLGNYIDQLEAKYGTTEFSKKVQGIRATRKQNEAAVKALEASNGDFKIFAETLMKENPETSIKDAKIWFDAMQKSRPKMESQAGKEMSDRTRLVADYGEDSPEVKAFDEKTKGKEQGTDKTIYGPGGQTKVVFIKKGQDYVPPKGWSLDAPSKADKGEGIHAQDIKDRRLKEAESSAASYGKATVKRAQEYVRKNPKMDSAEAAEKAKKDVFDTIKNAGSSSKALKALAGMGIDEEDAKDSIKKYIKKQAKGK